MNIGITIGLQQDNESLWLNGIKLNVLNLIETLSQIEGYNVYALDTSDKVKDLSKVSWDVKKYPIHKYKEKISSTDLLILLGTSFNSEQTRACKNKFKNIKIVKYHCGNNYVIDMERMIFPKDKKIDSAWTHGHDEAWFIPQQEYHNKSYYATIGRLPKEKVKVVPFVWNPCFIKNEDLKATYAGSPSAHYTPNKSREKMNLVSMEPNLNVVKFSLPLVLMAEEVYRKRGKGAFNEFWIASGKQLLKNPYYIDCIKNLDITESGKLKLCSRYPVQVFLSSKADVVLSNQWDNPLNYAYLDALYFGYPLIHNAHMIKDAGYYYEGFDTITGSEILDHVLNHHDEFLDKYTNRSAKVLARYMTTNVNIVNLYKKLIENVFEPGKHELSYQYDWKTNLYK
jgi:hypothetical protein